MYETTYYSDVTGDEITDKHQMLTIEVRPNPRPSSDVTYPGECHFASADHDFEYDRNQNGFTAIIGETGRVALIKEATGSRTKYYGQDTTDTAIQALITALNEHIITPA